MYYWTHLKHHNDRWFLFSHNENYKPYQIIHWIEFKIRETSKGLQESCVNCEDYFDDILGIKIPMECEA